MRGRKTEDIAFIRDMVNKALTVPDSSLRMRAPGKDRELTQEEAFRTGVLSVLESILHHTGQYKGFGYQDGVIPDPDASRPEWGDETRRIYY